MLKKELMAVLTMIGAVSPFAIQADLIGAYNQDANYKLDNSWDTYFTADFIYWNLRQDSMRTGNLVTPSSLGALGFLNGTNETLFNSGKYKPGIQVGFGFDMNGMDGWDLYFGYTWYQNKESNTANAKSDEGIVFSFAEDGAPLGITNDIVVADSITSKSQYYFNGFDFLLQRPFYFGRKLIANFGVGLKGLWISQTITNSATGVSSYLVGTAAVGATLPEAGITFQQRLWGIGPKFELGTNWILGRGFKIMANMAESVLYTRYITLTGLPVGGVTEGIVADLSTTISSRSGACSTPSYNYDTLRAVTETSLGLGWGSYFGDDNDFHLDITASYEFNIYWNQNMYGMVVNGNGSSGNTYLQGLNIAARFDF